MIKKSGYRKIAFFLGVSFEILERTIIRDEKVVYKLVLELCLTRMAQDNVTRAEFLVRASLPNGRFTDSYGSCDRREGASRQNPNHNTPATAETRAKSRAISDLVGLQWADSHAGS